MRVLVTGAAGFIGYHLTRALLAHGHEVIALDNLSSYYDVQLKLDRLRDLGVGDGEPHEHDIVTSSRSPELMFVRASILDRAFIGRLFSDNRFDVVCHLAAQAGVRESRARPLDYVEVNVGGTVCLLEAIRTHGGVRHFVYASSSSVYGLDTSFPFSERTAADHPASVYAASKRATELMVHSYAHQYGIPATGLRFFTVYGPWGRPDMAPILFARAIMEGSPIQVYNQGAMSRDFTFVADIIEGILKVLDQPPAAGSKWDGTSSADSPAPYKLYNIGNGSPVELLAFIEHLERAFGRKANLKMAPMQPGDVERTWADCTSLQRETGYRPGTLLADGVRQFADWFLSYYEDGSSA